MQDEFNRLTQAKHPDAKDAAWPLHGTKIWKKQKIKKNNREAIIFETAAFSSNQNNTPSVPQGITSPSIFCSLLVQGQDLSSLKDWTEPEEEEELDVCHSRVPDHTADLFEHDYR